VKSIEQDQKERSDQIHKALLDRRPRGPRFAIIVLIMFAILSLIVAFTITFLWMTAPNMTFSKDASLDYAVQGDTIVYTINYENLGSGDATDVTIRDTIPANVTFASSYPEYDNVSGTIYTWDIGTVTGGANGTISITVTVNAGVDNGVNLYNFATFDYNDDNGNPYDQITDDAKTLIKY